jgi:hypothetical protein
MMTTTFYFSKAGSIIPMCSGFISLLSSATMLRMILKSGDNSMYHQIMFFMGFWDIILSFSIGLTSIPMPKDVVYPFQGPVYGNFVTCEAQAFAFLVSSGFILSSNMLLTLYYLCIIRYNVDEEKFKKYARPIFLSLSTLFTFWMSIQLLMSGYLNPTPFESFCLVGRYPADCNSEDECIRGYVSKYTEKYFSYFVYCFVGGQLLILFVSMILIIRTCYVNSVTDHLFRRSNLRQNQTSSPGRKISTTKAVTLQALMYILAFVLTWAFPIISFFRDTTLVAIAKQIFQPLQGFFNSLIFIYHKIYNIHQLDGEMPFVEAFVKAVTHPDAVPTFYVSRLSLVEADVQFLRTPVEAKVSNPRTCHFSEDRTTENIANDLKEQGSIKASESNCVSSLGLIGGRSGCIQEDSMSDNISSDGLVGGRSENMQDFKSNSFVSSIGLIGDRSVANFDSSEFTSP